MGAVSKIHAMEENIDKGKLQVTIRSGTDNHPVENALVRISYTGDPDSFVEEVRTDESGQTPVLELKSPPLEYSMSADQEKQPYGEYTVQVVFPRINALLKEPE